MIEAASTKPFGFICRSTRAGLGGHCIPIDPFYLSWKARQNGFECRFIELAGHVNGSMPAFVVERVGEALNSQKKSINGSRIHVFGVAYKRDVSDMRESPALDVIELLHRRGAVLSYTDPHVPTLDHGGLTLKSVPERDAPKGIDCAVTLHQSRSVHLRRYAQAVSAGRRHTQRAQGHGRRNSLSLVNSQLPLPQFPRSRSPTRALWSWELFLGS